MLEEGNWGKELMSPEAAIFPIVGVVQKLSPSVIALTIGVTGHRRQQNLDELGSIGRNFGQSYK
jgi:hypothetical protein